MEVELKQTHCTFSHFLTVFSAILQIASKIKPGPSEGGPPPSLKRPIGIDPTAVGGDGPDSKKRYVAHYDHFIYDLEIALGQVTYV